MAIVRFPSSYISKNYQALAAGSGMSGGTGISGAVGAVSTASAVNGNAGVVGLAIDTRLAGQGLVARVSAAPYTNGLQMLAKWQVLDNDNATWQDVVDSYNPANVAFATGAGTSGGTLGVKYMTAPEGVYGGGRQARCVVYTAGSGPASSALDFVNAIAYEFRAPVQVYGP